MYTFFCPCWYSKKNSKPLLVLCAGIAAGQRHQQLELRKPNPKNYKTILNRSNPKVL